MVFGVFTGASGVLARARSASHSALVRVRKIVAQLGAQLEVAARVVGVLRAGPAFEQVGPVDRLAEVLPELLLRAMKSTWPSAALVELVAHALAHAGGAGRAALVVVRLVAGDLALGPLVGLAGLDAQPVDRGGGVGLRDLEERALAGRAGRARCRRGSPIAPKSGPALMPIETCSGMCGKPSSSMSGLNDAGPRVVRDAVARQVAVRAGHAVAGDRAQHDARVDLAQALEAEAAPRETARAHRLDHGVGAARRARGTSRRPRRCAGRGRRCACPG